MSEHIELEDLAMYALQSLPLVESAEIRDHLRECARCLREFREVGGDLALYGFSAPEYEVPLGSRERFLKEIAAGPRRVPATLPERKSTVVSIAPWLGWAVAAGLALFSVNLYQQTHGLRQSPRNRGRRARAHGRRGGPRTPW